MYHTRKFYNSLYFSELYLPPQDLRDRNYYTFLTHVSVQQCEYKGVRVFDLRVLTLLPLARYVKHGYLDLVLGSILGGSAKSSFTDQNHGRLEVYRVRYYFLIHQDRSVCGRTGGL